MLQPDRFACFVVGDFRDTKGLQRGFVGDTIAAFRDAGAQLYNEAILVTSAGSLPIRAGKAFEVSRKLGRTHQQVLVFVKGDARRATVSLRGGALMLPAPVIEEHAGVLVVRDDLLPGGTKMRAMLPLMQAQAASRVRLCEPGPGLCPGGSWRTARGFSGAGRPCSWPRARCRIR